MEPQEKYIIAGIEKGNWSLSSNPTVHYSETDAKKEAERLARSYPNKTFVVLKDLGKVTVGGLLWT